VLSTKLIIRCILGNEPQKILVRYMIEQARHKKGINRPFNLHDSITCPRDFNMEATPMLKRIWTSWREVSMNLERDLMGFKRGFTIGNDRIWCVATILIYYSLDQSPFVD
jgi:hypothetical protein